MSEKVNKLENLTVVLKQRVSKNDFERELFFCQISYYYSYKNIEFLFSTLYICNICLNSELLVFILAVMSSKTCKAYSKFSNSLLSTTSNGFGTQEPSCALSRPSSALSQTAMTAFSFLDTGSSSLGTNLSKSKMDKTSGKLVEEARIIGKALLTEEWVDSEWQA